MIVAIGILLFLALAGLAAGWIPSGKITPGQAVSIFAVCVIAAGGLTALQYRNSNNRSSSGTSTECPLGYKSSQPMTGAISNVQVKPVNALQVCVSWLNPDNPDVGGFIITQYPQDANGNKGPSGAPYPTPELSSQLIDVTQFVANLRPQPGERWKVCVTPIGKGVSSNGLYPTFSSRQGCSSTFTWPK